MSPPTTETVVLKGGKVSISNVIQRASKSKRCAFMIGQVVIQPFAYQRYPVYSRIKEASSKVPDTSSWVLSRVSLLDACLFFERFQ